MNSCDLNITRKYRFLLNLLNVFEMKFWPSKINPRAFKQNFGVPSLKIQDKEKSRFAKLNCYIARVFNFG